MLQQNIGNDEFDSEESSIQNLSFNTLQRQASFKNIEFNIKALHMLKKVDIYNNAAYLVSDQNKTTTKVAIYQGKNVMEFRDKREFSGSLISQINELFQYIELNNRTSVKIDGSPQRHETKDYPVAAVREAVVNAFAHRDYLLHSGIKVELFDDRMEILSPGGIPDGLTLEEIKDGMTAVRNPQLVHILDKLKYIENYGTGIRRIFEAYLDTGKVPDFEVRPNSFKVILPNVNYGNRIKSEDNLQLKDLDVNEESVLLILKREGKQTRKEIEDKLDTTPYYVRKILANLIKKVRFEKLVNQLTLIMRKSVKKIATFV